MIISDAIRARETTLRDFRTASGGWGRFWALSSSVRPGEKPLPQV